MLCCGFTFGIIQQVQSEPSIVNIFSFKLRINSLFELILLIANEHKYGNWLTSLLDFFSCNGFSHNPFLCDTRRMWMEMVKEGKGFAWNIFKRFLDFLLHFLLIFSFYRGSDDRTVIKNGWVFLLYCIFPSLWSKEPKSVNHLLLTVLT